VLVKGSVEIVGDVADVYNDENNERRAGKIGELFHFPSDQVLLNLGIWAVK
jgi:hypothetical protein